MRGANERNSRGLWCWVQAISIAGAFLAGQSALAQKPGPDKPQAEGSERLRVDAAIPDYKPQAGLSGTLRSVGSSTLSNLMLRWVQDFRLLHPDVQIEVVGGGSGMALAPLLEGKSDLAPMSRPMSKAEIDAFEKRFGYAPARVTVSLDAIAVYVNKDNPIERITLKQLDGVFSVARKRGGPEIRNWGQLGSSGEWKDRAIVIKSPAVTHGMHGLFKEMVLAGGDYRMDLRAEPVSTSIVQGVGAETGAIGFASYFYDTKRARPLAVSAGDAGPYVLPTQEACASGRYPLTRFLAIYVNRKPGSALPAETRSFLHFVCSKQGQEVAARGGNYPLSAEIAAGECAKQIE